MKPIKTVCNTDNRLSDEIQQPLQIVISLTTDMLMDYAEVECEYLYHSLNRFPGNDNEYMQN